MTQKRTTRRRRHAVDASARGQDGFTLVEAVIAMVVFIVGIMAIMNLFMMSSYQGQIANSMSAATTMASERLDVLKSIPFQTLYCGGAGGDLDSNDPGFNSVEGVRGVTAIRTRWLVEVTDFNGPRGVFITVRSEPTLQTRATGAFGRVQFSTYRSCTIVDKCECP